ncbi:hemerythrin-like metal-binding domain protein [Malonomonas rubra DSM 5091]|uniref:Hemerythrin-like metal-binding domain protein n=1 Tax=Malonomonas rubra DSM 5091 TaxID=1122189 RepID=A0A1M6IC19_MALRU|nr:bacteriohemerythrin [Malonomonas rubra]SHJ31856.1 hemerythrin-like metal-binding domain protein [Malonomonas rubra DSM 5091]
MSNFIDWSDKISVGIQELDEQHKHLVALINRLFEAMTEGENKAAVAKEIMNELIQYTVIHFAVEESLFRIFEYPDYDDHCRHHQELRAQVMEINKKVQSGERMVTPELLFFLKKWITNHIMVEDQKYAPFLLKKGVKRSWVKDSWVGKFWSFGH